MAISVIQLPSGVLAARNRQRFVFLTDNYITTAGNYHLSAGGLLSLPTDGQTVVYEIGTETITFTFKNTPTNQNHIQIGASINATTANWLTVVSRNYFLYTNYHLFAAGSVISHTARQYGAAWDIDFSASTASLSFITSAGIDEVVEETFRFFVALYVKSGSNYLLVNEAALTADAVQQSQYDAEDLLLGELDYDVPNYNGTTVSLGSKSYKEFVFKYWEYWDSGYNNGGELTYKAHLGGLMEKETPVIDYDDTYFTNATLQRFLTKHPRTTAGQTVTTLQQVFLYLYQKTGLGDAYVYLVIDYTDGTASTVVDPKFTISQPGDIVIIPAGYTQLSIDTHKTAGKTVSAYHLQVYYGADIQSATATTEGYNFTVDNSFYPYNRYFLIGNSLGGFDTLWCNGIAETETETIGENYKVNAPDAVATRVEGENRQNRALITTPILINTGWMDKDRMEFYSRELAASEHVYEIVNGQLVRIVVDRSSVQTPFTDATENFAFTFSYIYAQKDRI